MYSCTLCCCDSTAASMFAHIKGYKHREKYLGMKYNFVSEDKKAILAEARVRTCVIFSGFPYLSTLFCYKIKDVFLMLILSKVELSKGKTSPLGLGQPAGAKNIFF